MTQEIRFDPNIIKPSDRTPVVQLLLSVIEKLNEQVCQQAKQLSQQEEILSQQSAKIEALNGATQKVGAWHITYLEKLGFNEALCMKLAQIIGLQAASVEIGKVENIDYLLVSRYDRQFIQVEKSTQPQLARLHQEDFCQALGIVPERKYQSEGGPSLKQCFALLRELSSTPVIELRNLLDAVIFNFLIGNHDAHGKNFSLIYQEKNGKKEIKLAPLYDILSTAYYPNLSLKMAMKIGDEYRSDKILPRHFAQLSEEIGFSMSQVKKRVLLLAEKILETKSKGIIEHSVAQEVHLLIQKRCERIWENFSRSNG